MNNDTNIKLPNMYSSQRALNYMMAAVAVIKKDTTLNRGYYIVTENNPWWYLYHDGNVKAGVIAEGNSKDAFWDTYEEAEVFLNGFKKQFHNL